MANLVKEKKYIKADYKNNNNKFWYIFLYDDGSVTTEYGRVGKKPQSKTKLFGSVSVAEDFFEKKCKEKERAGRNGEIAYRSLNIVSNVSSDGSKSVSIKQDLAFLAEKQIEHDPDTVKLIRYLAKVNVHNIVSNTRITYNVDSGLFSTPCGIVTASTIDDARNLLEKIGANVYKGTVNRDSYGELINDYLMLIPQDLGMKRFDPSLLYRTQGDVRKQNDILDSLESSLNSVLSGANEDKEDKSDKKEPVIFKTKLVKVTDSKLIKAIDKKYRSTKKDMHACAKLKVKTVYEVEIKDMAEKFEKVKIKMNNVKELWHGTRASNLLSIMKSGLFIPPSNAGYCTGRMFGNGAYFASDSTKSLNYSFGYWNSGNYDNNCFMFIADVAMGKAHTPKGCYETLPKMGYDSTWAKAGISGVRNDEFVVYDISQCNLKYLVEFSN